MGENESDALAFDEFGVAVVQAGQTKRFNQPFGFTGYMMDEVSGLYFAQARYFDPATSRFISEDYVRDGVNWYVHCYNNPLIYIDRDGCVATRDVTDEVNNALQGIVKEAIERRPTVVEGAPSAYYTIKRAQNYRWFIDQVDHRKPWDIKRPDVWEGTEDRPGTIGTDFPGRGVPVIYNGQIMTPEQLGNFTYGYIGAALGLNMFELRGGSWVAAGIPIPLLSGDDWLNEFGDWKDIQAGFDAFNNSKGCD